MAVSFRCWGTVWISWCGFRGKGRTRQKLQMIIKATRLQANTVVLAGSVGSAESQHPVGPQALSRGLVCVCVQLC